MRRPPGSIRGGPPRSERGTEPTRRINITMVDSQHDELTRRNVNVSGLIRELVEEHLSETTITLTVDPETRRLYDEVMATTGYAPIEIDRELRKVLAALLDQKLRALSQLRDEIVKK